MAANLSYYFVLSLFPMLVVIEALAQYFKITDRFLLNKINSVIPSQLSK